MIFWGEFSKETILNDRSLLYQFTLDFRELFGETLNIGCKKCINDGYKRVISKQKSSNTMEKQSKKPFLLKKKYEGIMWKDQPIRNSDLTLEVALDLKNNHPRAELLFEIAPEDVDHAPTAKEMIKAIKEMSSIEEVEKALEGEERATVIAAGEKRVSELAEA